MGDKSGIEWTDATWNPVTGCSKVSPGCAHCYAETLTRRFAETWGVPDLPWTPANAEANVRLHPERLEQPLRWRRPRMVFVNSMSDLFHELVPFEFITQVFDVMERAHQHTFQVLTKRPERMRDFQKWRRDQLGSWGDSDVEQNIWLGTSIENRRFVGRADALRETPAAVRFISAEPLLGPLVEQDTIGGEWRDGYLGPQLDLYKIDWLIVGGESGPGHRPMDVDWVRGLREAAKNRHTAFFFKQWGGQTPKEKGRTLDLRTWDELPTREIVHAS